MSWFGAWFGGGDEAESGGDEGPAQVPVAIVYPDPVPIDPVQNAIDRLCEQFRSRL